MKFRGFGLRPPVWDNKEKHARKRVLVISLNSESNEIKYGLSNADITTTPVKQFAFMQANGIG